jgi:hypothetical protein
MRPAHTAGSDVQNRKKSITTFNRSLAGMLKIDRAEKQIEKWARKKGRDKAR